MYNSKLPYKKVTLKQLEKWLKTFDKEFDGTYQRQARRAFEYILEECKIDDETIGRSLDNWSR
jgi:hypothetical protein